MTESTPATKFIVPPPFGSDSAGDCILRTPDDTEFKVFKAILYAGSIIFRDMFDMPPAAQESKDEANIPIIPVDEDPETMQTLLQMLYPVEPPVVKCLSLARRLVTACDKYFVNNAKVRLHLKDTLCNSQSLKEDPLTCYSLSWRLGLEEEAIAASRYTHSVDLSNNAVAQTIVSTSGSLEAFARLWDLKFRREIALDRILALAQTNLSRDMACSHHSAATGSAKDHSIRKDGLRVALLVPTPVCSDVEIFLGFQAGKGNSACADCTCRRSHLLEELRKKVNAALTTYPQAIQGFSVGAGGTE